VDLIVMGSHGETGLKRLLFGSVTSTVLASCTTPLLVVRDKPPPKKQALSLGVALDGSRFVLSAVRFLVKYRDLFGSMPTVNLIHVVPDLAGLLMPGFPVGSQVPGINPARVEAMQTAAFEQAVAPARKLVEAYGMPVKEVRLIGNNAGDEVAAFASKRKLNVLILGSHGQGGLRGALLGSVATRVAVQSRIPLLFVREK
jgi:nucleotide-binding universal stress UspA family protein